jgi:hypothetical protein
VPGFPGKIAVEVFHEAGELGDIAGAKQKVEVLCGVAGYVE